jgi:Protein of unknown function (DUF4058)
MPSPFPGMDPYLEGEMWSTFHHQSAVQIARALIPQLVPRYYAYTEKYENAVDPEEIGIALSPEAFYPDISVARTAARGGRRSASKNLTLAVPLKLDTVLTIPTNHFWIKILDRKERQLVTAIEFLSPTNKRGNGRKLYLKKRRRLLLSQAHLMEIDLLRTGLRVPMATRLPEAAYFVFLSRAGHRPETEVWPVGLDQQLPTVKVPLLEGDADVDLDLQEVFNSVYDLGAMEFALDYRREPDVPLPPDWAVWADQLLRSAHKRRRGKERGA